MKKENFLFMLLSCGLGHRHISSFPGLHKSVASCQGQGFIHTFLLTNPRHTLLSCTILLACLTSKHLFFKQSFVVSIHLFHSLSTERLPVLSPSQTLLAILLFSILFHRENTFINLFIYTIHHPARLPYLCIREFLLIPSKLLRVSVSTTLILDLSFSLHIIVSLPYVRTSTSDNSCKTLSSCSRNEIFKKHLNSELQ